MKGKVVLVLSMLLLFIVVIQPAAMAARVLVPTDAKPKGTSEVADAELDQQKGLTYRTLHRPPVCSTSPGGAYSNNCFRVPAPPRSP
ncbi:hypothetical protein QJS04_geneDACA017840 [Acorus gramineus]|uniref:Uncharacterized protein n=1 Tax=Acorus gramineus TaxID=55184 RepID=A0AAV9ALY3_ACOGR|nr:hypothetical protein QJS04_geneDACA017840 [Acorus gramineus]